MTISKFQCERKGILLAGGSGSRLGSLTRAVSKHLLPVFDKPMIYYPLSTLMTAGIRDILLIATPRDLPDYRMLLGDGSEWGVRIAFEEQARPRGIAEALVIAEPFLDGGSSALILGDNVLVGAAWDVAVATAAQHVDGAAVFAVEVDRPQDYGIVALDGTGRPTELIEKPVAPKSNLAVVGLYFYDADAVEISKRLQPSSRGELEITDVNREYMRRGRLKVVLPTGAGWIDAGTPDRLWEAGEAVCVLQRHMRSPVGDPAAIARLREWPLQAGLESPPIGKQIPGPVLL